MPQYRHAAALSGGDWALGPRVKAAYLSGQAIAEDVIKQFS